jgi:hypothetical protein
VPSPRRRPRVLPGASSTMRAAARAALVVLLAWGAGCTTVRHAPPAASGEAAPAGRCRDGEYRGSFKGAGRHSRQSFRLSARLCTGGGALLEFRGVIGGAGLVAGVKPGEAVRLLFPSRRLAVDGPDAPWFWEKWTGVPFDGSLVTRLAASTPPPAAAGGWSARVAPPPAGETLPARLDAKDDRGSVISLRKTAEKASPSDDAWPEPAPGFRVRKDPGDAPEDASEPPDGNRAPDAP